MVSETVFFFFLETSSMPDTFSRETSTVAASDSDTAQTPTEDTINNLIEDFQLYQDPFLTAVITECHGRTPLHIAVSDKHEDVVNCFIDFQGRF